MRTFRCETIQDASDLPWVFEIPPVPTDIPVWGVNIAPWPVYASYNYDEHGNRLPVGEPLYFEWQSLLDPPNTSLPNWITEAKE
jgi:hypothetical protein